MPPVAAHPRCVAAALLLALFAAMPARALDEPLLPAAGLYRNFESGQVRPLALTPDGTRLLAVNTPANRLEILDVQGTSPVLLHSVPVGMEPVAVAARSNEEAWVVNHLSDSVSVVRLTGIPHVARTLQVGDEPRDIVFAGHGRERAFITAAHRGQNAPFDPQSLTPGLGRADVWVFEAARGASTPLAVLSLFGDTPRPLAVSPDASRVYAGVFNSGNRSTVLAAEIARGALAKPGPQADAAGNRQPRTGLIVRWDGNDWVDHGDPEAGVAPGKWSERVRFSLPDHDVFEIDANATPPAELRRFDGVGTTLFNMAVNPVDGTLYVSNTEARNHVRFEGEGKASTTVRGHFVESRITVIRPDGTVRPRHLNKHIQSYAKPLGTPWERARSLATPLGLAVRSDGQRLYLAAFGSARVAWYGTRTLADGTFTVDPARQIPLSAGGPSGLVLDEPRKRLYVLTRFDNGISTVSLATHRESHHLRLFDPEPAELSEGRRFLYDARLSSSRGDSSCAGCHVFGDMDHLAWDLGNPDALRVASRNTYNSVVPMFLARPTFHPMKGPMSTQSLRGLAGHGPMHWRGDRSGLGADPDESLEEQAFEEFNGAFRELLGRASELSPAQMDAFAKFALSLQYPPNPHRALDNTLDADEQAGSDFYHDVVSDTIATCNGCHVLDEKAGFFGSDGTMSIEGPSIDEDFKIPHLRNTYQKVGMFGSTGSPRDGAPPAGEQIRGFGFAHDASVDTLTHFLSAGVFAFPNETVRRQTAEFVLAFPSDLAPVVGQQLTMTPDSAEDPALRARLDLLIARAAVREPRAECELVAAGLLGGARFSALLNAAGSFTRADAAGTRYPVDALLEGAATEGSAITFTCVPPGSGLRIAIDRDLDGIPDAEH